MDNPYQLKSTSDKENIDSIIEKINKNIYINDCFEFDLYGYSTDGAVVDFFLKDSTPIKIIANFFGEMGSRRLEYYISDSKPIFFKDIRYMFERPYQNLFNVDTTIISSVLNKDSLNNYYFKTYLILVDSSKTTILRSCSR